MTADALAFPPDVETDEAFRGMEVSGVGALKRYRLERVVGAGSQAIAVLARGTLAGDSEPVVVKVWRPGFVREVRELALLALRKELVAMQRLSVTPSPHVVRLLDQGEMTLRDGAQVPFLVLEHVDGGGHGVTLLERVEQCVSSTGKGFSPSRARRLLAGIARGLRSIHGAQVVHRDLRPPNVLLTGWGENELAKVSDLGVSRPMGMETTFAAWATVGAAGFAAPEQHSRNMKRIGPWSDIFSFGAVAHFVLAAAPMFEGSQLVALAAKQLAQWTPLAERPGLHPAWGQAGVLPALDAWLKKVTAPRWDARPSDIEACWQEVEPLFAKAEAVAGGALAGPLRSVAEGAEPGEKVGVGPDGLSAWRQGRWQRLPTPAGLQPAQLWSIAAVGKGRWLGAGPDGVAVFTEDRCERRIALPEVGLSVFALAGKSVRSFALGGTLGGGVLVAFHDGHWLPTLRLPPGLAVVTLATVDAEPGVIAYDVTCETSAGERSVWRWFVLSGMLGRMEGVGGG